MIPWPDITAGEDVVLRIPSVRDADTGLEFDLTAATAIEWQLRRRPREPGQGDDDPSNPVILKKDLLDGITVDGADILIELTAEDTGELANRYYADCWIEIAGRRRVVKNSQIAIFNAVNAP